VDELGYDPAELPSRIVPRAFFAFLFCLLHPLIDGLPDFFFKPLLGFNALGAIVPSRSGGR